MLLGEEAHPQYVSHARSNTVMYSRLKTLRFVLTILQSFHTLKTVDGLGSATLIAAPGLRPRSSRTVLLELSTCNLCASA